MVDWYAFHKDFLFQVCKTVNAFLIYIRKMDVINWIFKNLYNRMYFNLKFQIWLNFYTIKFNWFN